MNYKLLLLLALLSICAIDADGQETVEAERQRSVGSGIKELIVDGKKVGKVKITYMMISANSKSNAISFEALPNRHIDMTKYPDAKLRISIELLEDMKSKYKIKFTRSKFSNKIQGFSRTTSIRPASLTSKGNRFKVDYSFDKSLLNGGGHRNFLSLTIPVYYKENGNPRTELNYSSIKIKVVNVPINNPPAPTAEETTDNTTSSEESMASKAANLLTQIKQAKLANDSDGLKVACGEYMDLYYESASSTIKKDVDDICSPKTSGNNNIVDGKKTSDQYYKEISSTKNPQKLIKLLKDYSIAYSNKDPNYSKIYYHVTTIKELPRETQIAFCKEFLDKIKNSSHRDLVKARLENLTKKPPPASDPDQKAWNKAVANANKTSSGNKKIEYYEDYLKKWKNYKSKANAAIALLKEEFTIEELSRTEKGRDTEVVYKILGAEGKEPGLSKLPSGVNSVNWNSSSKEMTMSVENEKKYIFNLYVPDNDDKKENVILDLKVPALAFTDFEDIGEQLALRISGGKPPYRVQLKNDAGIIIRKKKLLNIDDKWVVNKADLGENLSGSFSICVLDEYNNSKCADNPYTISNWDWALLPLAFLVVGGCVFLFYRKVKNSQKPNDEFVKRMENVRKEKIEVRPENPKSRKIEIAKNDEQKTSVKVTKTPPIKVTTEKGSIATKNTQTYHTVDLTNQWEESVVGKVNINSICIEEVHQYLAVEKEEEINMQLTIAPEIGGVLFGRKRYDLASRSWNLEVDQFMPVKWLDDQEMVALDEEVSRRLDQAVKNKDEEEMEALGWLHVHPGWGVFLSKEDIFIHNTNFRNVHQIAVVLDLRKAENNFGIFSRKNDLSINNTNDKKSLFLNWKDFTKKAIA